MKKLLVVLLTVLFILTGCSGGGKEEAAEEVVYVVGVDAEPATMNPDAISDDNNYSIVQNIFPRLYKLNNAFNAIPDLATSYDVSDDALTYTFHLRDNALWTDGEKVTSADVLYTFEEIVNNSYAFESVFTYVESMEAPDDYTFVFHMSEPDGSFVPNLAWYGTFILPKHVLEGTDWMTNDEFSNNPVSCGPYKLDVWNKGTDVQIVRDDNYWGDRPQIDRVIFTVVSDSNTMYQAWLNGEIDEIGAYYIPTTDLEGIMADTENYYTVTQVWPSPWYVTFNLEDENFGNVLVREACMYGIDREDVSVKATGGYKPANDHFIPDNYVNAVNDDAKEADYDPEKAMQLLEQAGYTKNADGYYFECEFAVMEGFDDFCKVIADNLDKIGIKCKLTVLDYNIWVEKCLDNYEFEITALGGFQGPDVLGTTRRWTTDGAVNVPRYSREEVDALAKQAVQAATDEERNNCIKEVQKYLREDVPFILCVNYADYQPFKSYIKGNNYVSVADGGSMEKSGFSEYTYFWLDK